ncbi:MAG: hypothetical protein JNM83_04070 [Myxococcales bacterium]|nr:hypothetical protein [Myxococcales bacterium]
MSKRVSGFAVPFFVLLSACDGTTSTGAVIPAGGLNFPNCPDGSLLGIDANRGYICVSVSASTATAPVCTASQALTVEGGALKCVEKGTGNTTKEISDQITSLEAKYTNLNNKVNDIQTPSGIGSQFVGQTDLKFSGKIVGPTNQVAGVGGAADACIAKFGKGAHMCTPFELFLSASAKHPAFTSTTTMPQGWVYMIGWNRGLTVSGVPSALAEDDYAGVGENCGGFTQGDSTKGWVGTVAAWNDSVSTRAPSGTKALHFTINATTTCDKTFPITCCR